MHVQFQTILPYERICRLLIVLQLLADGLLRTPMLYSSPLRQDLTRAVPRRRSVHQLTTAPQRV
jgi:hypothetical protein